MKTIVISSMLMLVLSGTASASFRVDYEGLDVERALAVARERQLNQEPPEGFRLLTDKQVGIVLEVGERAGSMPAGHSAGQAMPIKDAMSMIMPDSWICYIKKSAPSELNVSWVVSDGTWLDAINSLGVNHELRFLIDWDQRMVQLMSGDDFYSFNHQTPSEYTDPSTGRRIFVYSSDPVDSYQGSADDAGVLIREGRAIGVLIID